MFVSYKIIVKFWLNLWILCAKNPQSVSFSQKGLHGKFTQKFSMCLLALMLFMKKKKLLTTKDSKIISLNYSYNLFTL